MNYNDIYDGFIELFPEDKAIFKELSSKNGAYKEDGMHIVFGMVVVPYIISIVNNDSEKAQKAFDYIEIMETSGNPNIAEVVEFTILESLLDSDDKQNLLGECIKYMGKETKAAFDDISGWFHS